MVVALIGAAALVPPQLVNAENDAEPHSAAKTIVVDTLDPVGVNSVDTAEKTYAKVSVRGHLNFDLPSGTLLWVLWRPMVTGADDSAIDGIHQLHNGPTCKVEERVYVCDSTTSIGSWGASGDPPSSM